MNERNMSIVFSSRFDRLTECNASFDKGVLRVCYVGKNRNNSFISKSTFDRCINSIYNCPIVCRYDRDADEIGSHDMELVHGTDGSLDLVNLTTPVGVIPESANCWYEEIEEDDGTIHEYLCAEALLWKRQEAYRKIKDDGITDESMEISIKNGHMEDGVYIIDDFEFTAFCLLGTAEPCYESASLLLFSRDDFKAQMSEMMRDFKECFSMVQSSQEVVDKTQNYSEGGEEALDEKRALMAQYGLSEEMLDFNLDDLSVEELTEKFEAMTGEQPEAEVEAEVEEQVEPEVQEEPEVQVEPVAQFELHEQFKSELIDALYAVTTETSFGEMNRYWYVDFDAEAGEVYCNDCEDWNLYGFHYSMNGDHVVIDFESKKRKKFTIVDFDEGEQMPAFASAFAAAAARYTENEQQWAEKYQALETAKAETDTELETLRQFKAGVEQTEAENARNDVFAMFTDLVGDEAFETLRENCELSAEELEEKCFALRGRKQTAMFALGDQKAPKLPIETTVVSEDEPYGGIFVKYGIK